jgi:hypothetical protein
MTDDIKDRALALVLSLADGPHDQAMWKRVLDLASEAEAAEKKWRVRVVMHTEPMARNECDRRAEMIRDREDGEWAQTVDVVPAEAPLVPPRADVAEAVELLRGVVWEDRPDQWSEEIHDAFPTRSGSHEEYADAMRMVGNRRSKGALVALVNWLLVELNRKHTTLVGVADKLRKARTRRDRS